MSRVGLKVINIPSGVTLKVDNSTMTITGPKGTLNVHIPDVISLDSSVEGKLSLKRANDEKQSKQLHGTTRSLINDAIIGVSEGFTKTLEIVGIGYRATQNGANVVLEVGYSHKIEIAPSPGSKINVVNPTKIEIVGFDKQAVGQTAANIRAVRKPEPYLGKGIKYSDERIIRKEGKRAGAGK